MADQTSATSTASSGLTMNTAAAISYVTIIPAIVFLLIAPYDKNPFVRFHSVQSILLGFFAFGAQTLLLYTHFIPMGFLISMILSAIFFILWVLVVVKAMTGEWFKLPILGSIAMSLVKKP